VTGNQPGVAPETDPVSATASSDPVPDNEVGRPVAGAKEIGSAGEVVDPAQSKSAHADSSSNPDSGYSGMSGGGVTSVVRHLAPCSESSSLHSASSGELVAADNPATIGSSVCSDSMPSVCNSL